MQPRDWIAGIVGGRNFTDYDYMVKQLKLWQGQNGKIVAIISGGAPGADTLAEKYSLEYLKKKAKVLEAKWGRYGDSAGPIRNKQIVQASQVIIAFPDPSSKGTWSTVRIAKKEQVPVYVYRYWINSPRPEDKSTPTWIQLKIVGN